MGQCDFRHSHPFETDRFAALRTMEMGVVVAMAMVVAIVVAKGVARHFRAVYRLVYDAPFLEGAEGAVQGDPVGVGQVFFQLGVGEGGIR